MEFNVPQECKDQNWRFDPVSANVEYGGVDDITVNYDAIGAGYEEFTSTILIPELYGAGFRTDTEADFLMHLRDVLDVVADAIQGGNIHPAAVGNIVDLAGAAGDQIDGVQEEYASYLESYPDSYPISKQATSPFPRARQEEARAAIRKKLKDAGVLLNCALYSLAQTESWARNKEIYEAQKAAEPFALEGEGVELGFDPPRASITTNDPARASTTTDDPDIGSDEEVTEDEEVDEPPEEKGPGIGMILGIGGAALLALLVFGRK